ncbi:hypothetical protein KY358_06500 [Candidatus Woesearchaeota archaeon]|nr:hypothetical protein [Candidatus Woesearchaeota archaeon]
MGDSKFSFFIIDLILLVVFLGMIRIIFRFDGLKFILELLALTLLLLIAFIALIPAYSGSKGGWGFISGIFLAVLLNLLVIYIRTGMLNKTYLLTSLFAALGFVVSIINIKDDECCMCEGPFEEEKQDEEVYTNFDPGKYVASRTGKTYHTPKCDWAKKINKKNQVWFDSEEEAKKDHKPHSCIE